MHRPFTWLTRGKQWRRSGTHIVAGVDCSNRISVAVGPDPCLVLLPVLSPPWQNAQQHYLGLWRTPVDVLHRLSHSATGSACVRTVLLVTSWHPHQSFRQAPCGLGPPCNCVHDMDFKGAADLVTDTDSASKEHGMCPITATASATQRDALANAVSPLQVIARRMGRHVPADNAWRGIQDVS